MLKREEDGRGYIFAKQLKRKFKFQVPDNQLASVSRRDSVQHPFFEDLYRWGMSIRHYKFGEKMGKDHVAIITKKEDPNEDIDRPNPIETQKVVAFLDEGIKRFGGKFKKEIEKAMRDLGYEIEDVGIELATDVKITPEIAKKPYSLFVK